MRPSKGFLRHQQEPYAGLALVRRPQAVLSVQRLAMPVLQGDLRFDHACKTDARLGMPLRLAGHLCPSAALLEQKKKGVHATGIGTVPG